MHLIFLDGLASNKFMQAFCWMLVHSLWQGLVLTIICSSVILLTKKYHALLRYKILIVLFFLFLIGCGCTFVLEFLGVSANNNNTAAGLAAASQSSYILTARSIQRLLVLFTNHCSANASMLVIIWFVVFAIKITFMIRGVQYGRNLIDNNTQPAETLWQERLRALCIKLGINKEVLLLESTIIKIPVVIGYFKPIILLPIGLVTHLPAEQVEPILLHELAHIRRNDYLVNFFQNLTETVFFFNPALLWLSSLIREERENCCDDVTLDHTNNKKQFLEALISFKEHAVNATAYATAFPGKKNQLLHRFTRIIANKNNSLDFSGKLFMLLSIVCCSILFVAVASDEYNEGIAARLDQTGTTPVKLSETTISISDSTSELLARKKQLRVLKLKKVAMQLKTEAKAREIAEQVKQKVAAYENEKMALDKKQQAEQMRIQEEVSISQEVRYREQLKEQHEKEEEEKEVWETRINQERQVLDKQRATQAAQDAHVRKLKAEKDAAFLKQKYY